jgi:hypothetical protein
MPPEDALRRSEKVTMREVNPSGDAKGGASAQGGSPSEPPPSSTRGFIGTNIDAAQAYVPPTTLPETPEPPVPNTKVALSEGVDPRKAPTMPNLKKAALGIAAEVKSEKPPPVIEAPPDSQISAIRRGAGYAPSRGSVPGAPASTRPDPIPRSTPPKGLKTSVRPPPAEAVETPAQRRAALIFIFLFAALLAVAVYFFLRRAPAPTEGATPTGTAITTAPAAPTPAPTVAPAPAPTAAPEPSVTASAATATAAPPSAGTAARSTATSAASEAPSSTAPPATAAPTPSQTAAPAPSGPDGPKTDRWF